MYIYFLKTRRNLFGLQSYQTKGNNNLFVFIGIQDLV